VSDVRRADDRRRVRYNITGSVLGSPTATPLPGKFSNGINFANSSQQVQWPEMYPVIGTAPFTVECWFKRTRTADGGIPAVAVAFDARDELQLGVAGRQHEQGCAVVDQWQRRIQVIQSVGTVTDTTTFHHAMATYDGTTARVFLDGTLGATLATTFQDQPRAIVAITASGVSNARP
jgi:hypothetical protein